MCGITGILNLDGSPIDRDILKSMNQAMLTRGPDDSGYYFDKEFGMAMRRLSIIDLDTGHQPISNKDGTIQVVLNGEIYNYLELRKKLLQLGYQFSTNTDTEVLVYLYEEFETKAVDYLNGMFAFSIWDSKRRRLWIVRDRLGIKPLVYFRSKRGIIFASTLIALTKHPDLVKVIDKDSLLLYFSLAYIPTPRTIWKGVKKLHPGHWLMVENGQIKTNCYWRMEPQSSKKKSRNEFANKVNEVFKQSIKLRSRSDVPVGTFLSGGLDSSAVTSYFCSYSKKPVHTFTMDFEGKNFNEGHYAAILAKKFETEHHFNNLTFDMAMEGLDELLPLLDEPLADSAIIPSYFLSKWARDLGIKVMLSGAGGDELVYRAK